MNSRGFTKTEYSQRLSRAQKLMGARGIDALLLTTQPDFYYFSGFLTRFWESPTRPWFLILPQSGAPVAVIPSIGAHLMARGFVDDIRTWSSPDLHDDGISLLAETLKEVCPNGRLGLPSGFETFLRLPLSEFEKLKLLCKSHTFHDDQNIVRDLRMVKSTAEIEKISHACDVANHAFARVDEIAKSGVPVSQVFREFQMLCLQEGADWVPYLAGGAGQFGQADVISPATDDPLVNGDILMLDTGLVWDGYFCDFDRNFAIDEPDQLCRDAHGKLIEATQAAFEICRPGTTAAQLYHAMDKILTNGKSPDGAGRLGHGLGIQLTEWPSVIPDEDSEMKEGVVMTLEPSIATRDGQLMVHEENIVITKDGARYLSSPCSKELKEI